jgi:hypothetical protein
MARLLNEALKSIPHSENCADVLTLADHGTTGAVTDQGAALFDLESETDTNTFHEGLAFFEASTQNGQGGTPTSPGAAVTLTLKYAFVNEKLAAVADATTVLADLATSFVITFPDSSSAAAAGKRIHQSGTPFIIQGRYLYVWYDRDAFAANALVDVDINLVRV